MTTTQLDAAQTVADLYALDQNIRRAESDVKAMKQERETLANIAADLLGKGGAVMIHDGSTVAFVTDGRRTINKDAIHANAEALPASLLPHEEVVLKYPGVGDIDKRDADLRARGLDPADLVQFSGARWTVQFRASED